MPAELAKLDEVGLVLLSRNVGADGQILSTLTKGTHPPLERAVDAEWRAREWELPAVKRGGKPVATLITSEQVFSPFELPDEPGDDLLGLEKKSPDKIVPIAKLDVPLKIVSRREPIFPVTVAPGVTKTGRVRLPRIKSASDDAFGYAAVQAASGWWFEPPLVNGKPVVVREEIPFRFAKGAP